VTDIIKPDFGTRRSGKPRLATVTHEVPSKNPDRNLRDLADTDGLIDMGRLGLDCEQWPHVPTEGSERVGKKTLREWRDRLVSIVEAQASIEAAAGLVRCEAATLSRRITEILGDDGPKGAA